MLDFSRKPTLPGELVTLRPAQRADVDVLWPLLADVEMSRLTGSIHSSTPTADELRPWSRTAVEDIYARWATATDRTVWVIVENATGAVVGESVLNDLDADNLSCGFRIWIAGAQGRGLGTEAVSLTMAHAFADQGLHRVSLEVYDFNPRARHVYEKVGFAHEGTLRDALRFDGEWVDAHLMGLLAHEWAERTHG